jgi:hypothetical protein
MGAGSGNGLGWFCNELTGGPRSTKSGRCWNIPSSEFHHFVAQGQNGTNYSEYFSGVEIFPPFDTIFSNLELMWWARQCNVSGVPQRLRTLCHGDPKDPISCRGRSNFAGAATDGKDMGAVMSEIDQARVKLQFTQQSFPH